MALFGRMGKAALAGFAVKQARKPSNQQKLKNAFASLTGRGSKASASRRGGRGAATTRRRPVR